MEIKTNKYIAVTYKLYADIDGNNEVVEETTEGRPYQYISGMGMSLPAFERALDPLSTGDTFDFVITKEEAYGEYLEEHVVDMDKKIFMIDGKLDPKTIYEDAMVPLVNEDGNQFIGHILEIGDDHVTVDLNHPLAGLDLHFIGTVVESREATNAEIERVAKMLSGEGCGCGSCGDCNDGSCGGCGGC
jgi:FKBP-type peptidyl-prolyl cis-trans isomerase SlyD